MLHKPGRMHNYQKYVKEFQICKQYVNEESLRDEDTVQWEGKCGDSAGGD